MPPLEEDGQPTPKEDWLYHFHHRLLQDAVANATSTYWQRRAEAFEAAKPRPDEFHGSATRDDLRAQWRRLDEAARSCRARAQTAPLDDVSAEVTAALDEVA